ncbi:MAG: NUDIX domain-containing protein [Arachnia sp.]
MSEPDVDPLPGEGWALGPDGMPHRDAARVLLFDHAGRLLLVNAHDAQNPERTWWFTVGGGIDDGETAREAAAREVREETGLELDPASFVGPVAVRSSVFDFFARHVRQDEEYFVARIDRAPSALDTAGWTDVERAFMDGLGWFTSEEIAELDVEVFPVELPELLESLADGWDGTVRRLGDA